jgi:RHS repeat-associated protein
MLYVWNVRENGWWIALLLGLAGASPALAVTVTTTTASMVSGSESSSAAPTAAGVTATPDLFTGAVSYGIPLDLPPGRKGMQPSLIVKYRSGQGSGVLGVGWQLELGAIERSTRGGVDHAGNAYVLRDASGSTQLMAYPGAANEYRAVIEQGFARVRKLVASDGRPYFEVTDRNGIRMVYGRSASARQAASGDPGRIFRWNLERVEDRDGNYIAYGYMSGNGPDDTSDIYPDTIAYAGNADPATGAVRISPPVQLKFRYEPRGDFTLSYLPGFKTASSFRLRAVDVTAGGSRFAVYILEYGLSTGTLRDVLTRVSRYGSDAVLGSFARITSGTPLTTHTVEWPAAPAQGWANPVVAFDSWANGSRLFRQGWTANFDADNWETMTYADVNGDGRADACLRNDEGLQCYLSQGAAGFVHVSGYDSIATGQKIFANGSNQRGYGAFDDDNRKTLRFADVTGDGKADACIRMDYGLKCWISTGSGWTEPAGFDSYQTGLLAFQNGGLDVNNWSTLSFPDLNGDGKSDACLRQDRGLQCYLSTGSGFAYAAGYDTVATGQAVFADASPQYGGKFDDDNWSSITYPDLNGDSRADACIRMDYGLQCWLSTGSGWRAEAGYDSHASTPVFQNGSDQYGYGNFDGDNTSSVRFPDVNGDGRSDACIRMDYGVKCVVSTGTGWSAPSAWDTRAMGTYLFARGWDQKGYGEFDGDNTVFYADVNGDGRSDACLRNDWGLECWPSTDDGFVKSSRFDSYGTGQLIFQRSSDQHGYGTFDFDNTAVAMPDVNGDGKADACVRHDYGVVCWLNQTPFDLVSRVSDEKGGSVSLAYSPSTRWANPDLPFVVQAVSTITTSAGRGAAGITTLEYSGGFFHLADQEFRGFATVVVTRPAGASGERLVETHRFHQGNESSPGSDPSSTVGYMKGKPYSVEVKGTAGELLSTTTTEYHADADGKAPWFTPRKSVYTAIYDGDTVRAPVEQRVTYAYDEYGNVTQEDRFGNLATSTDDVRILRTYQPNTSAWILALPASEEILAGFTSPTRLAASWMYYDGTPRAAAGATDLQAPCSQAATSSVPTAGDLTRVVKWNSLGTSVEERKGYDVFGNAVCTRDARGAISTIAFDATATFPIEVSNALGHRTVTEFYGVDGVTLAGGLYGLARTKWDPNGAPTVFEYDVYGRPTRKVTPDGTWTRWTYVAGAVGVQRVRSDDALGGWLEEYFDGAGRTYREVRPGANGKKIVVERTWDARGALRTESLPYFEDQTPRSVTRSYDALGREVRAMFTAGQTTIWTRQACHLRLSSGRVDENGQRRRETRSVQGWLQRVDEYLGTGACTTEDPGAYATTTYQYDPLGRLTVIRDTRGNLTVLVYDSLGRRTGVNDPDTGWWTYGFDENGNTTSIRSPKDIAQGTGTTLAYDALNRPLQQDNPVGADVEYRYDQGSYGLGHRTSMTDGSGQETYEYDAMGRRTLTTKIVDGTAYPIRQSFDGRGRILSVEYPGETVTYRYDAAGNLVDIPGYATFTGHNALGQPGTVTYANGVVTSFGYGDTTDARLNSLRVGLGSQPYLDLRYVWVGGNIIQIGDQVDAARTQIFEYDALGRLTRARGAYGVLAYAYDPIGNLTEKEGVSYVYGARPHAVASTSAGQAFTYDENGNTLSDGQRLFAYDDGDQIVGITAPGGSVAFVNDGEGRRVKKISASGTSVYVGRYLECTAAACARYVFAGDTRIAVRTDADVKFYHQNHQGSTALVTDAAGRILEGLDYLPFGATQSDAGAVSMTHKFTGQALDPETGLYDYKARFYDPVLGRFLSPDTLLQNVYDPQALNRYTYCRNNPVVLVDESGHLFGLFSFAKALIKSVLDFTGMLFFHGGLDLTSGSAMQHAWDGYGRSFRDTWKEMDPFLRGSEMNNELMMDAGFFLHIPGWESLQASLGYMYGQAMNVAGYVDEVRFYRGAVLVNIHNQSDNDASGMTLGPYIALHSRDLKLSAYQSRNGSQHQLLKHEHGHTVQSRFLGPLYMGVVAIPSLASQVFDPNGHTRFWVEAWASDAGGANGPEYPTDITWFKWGFSLL